MLWKTENYKIETKTTETRIGEEELKNDNSNNNRKIEETPPRSEAESYYMVLQESQALLYNLAFVFG